MKLIESSAELIQQDDGLYGLYKHIETCGRVPYKSEDKSDGTIEGAKAFVERMIKSNHLAVLEHGTVYLKLEIVPEKTTLREAEDIKQLIRIFEHNPYSKVEANFSRGLVDDHYEVYSVTTNYRVIVENKLEGALKYICSPSYHKRRYTFKVVTSVGVTRELNRHRMSILEQSTRYCNFSKDKFENEIKFVRPTWVNLNNGRYEIKACDIVGDGYIKDITNLDHDNQFLFTCLSAEESYMNTLKSEWNDGWTPQQVRELLPLCLASEAVYTGDADQWKHFFELRFFETTGKVHPNMLDLTTKMKKVAVDNGIWDDIMK